MGHNTQIQAWFAHTSGEFRPGYKSEFPSHAAVVHFPIAFNILSWILDVLVSMSNCPSTISRILMFIPRITMRYFGTDMASHNTLLEFARTSYFMQSIGLLSSIPAMMSGMGELLKLIQRNCGSIYRDNSKEVDGKGRDVVPRIKMAIIHAAINQGVFLVNWLYWRRKRSMMVDSFGGIEEENVLLGGNAWISLILLIMLGLASNLGGRLVFNFGVGLNLGRAQVDVDLKDI